jgi:hypothetical protein
MVAATAADIDGIGFLISSDAYSDFHHVVAHNGLFAVVVAGVLAACSYPRGQRRCRSPLLFLVYLGLVHLHLVMDYCGSGREWALVYLWPFSRREFVSAYGWDFFSWQNMTAAAGSLAWTVWIAVRWGRTPLEVVMPSLDRKLVARSQ